MLRIQGVGGEAARRLRPAWRRCRRTATLYRCRIGRARVGRRAPALTPVFRGGCCRNVALAVLVGRSGGGGPAREPPLGGGSAVGPSGRGGRCGVPQELEQVVGGVGEPPF